MKMAKLKSVIATITNAGGIAPLFQLFQGRCTFFACLFAGVGIGLAFLGKLTAEYVALITAIQALLLAHSAKEDYHERATGGVVPPDPSTVADQK
jgi:Mn2+/Fe2+ NRAMP family transporter